MSALMLLMSQVILLVIITVGIKRWGLHPLKFLFGRATPPTPPPPMAPTLTPTFRHKMVILRFLTKAGQVITVIVIMCVKEEKN